VRRLSLPGALLLVLACRGPSADEPPSVPAEALPEAAVPVAARASEQAGPAEPATRSQPAAAAEPTFGPAALRKLGGDDRSKLLAGPADEPIPVPIHYVQSNETRHDLFFPFIEGKGGAFIGVGSDQSYTMIAAARSELVFMLDIDYRVVDLHEMYRVFILRSDTPQALVDCWKDTHEEAMRAVLAEGLAHMSEDDRDRIDRGYRIGRETVYRHLLRVISRAREGKPTSWLSDPQMYDHIRALFQTDRVRIMPGNLAGAASMRTAGAAAAALGEKVTVLYMSNAEEYFKYTAEFAANIAALPIDEHGMILRTIYSKKWEHADLWAYQVQPIADLRARLGERKNSSRRPMLFYAESDGSLDRDTGHKGLTLVGMAKAG
jgi:hypothetical protein